MLDGSLFCAIYLPLKKSVALILLPDFNLTASALSLSSDTVSFQVRLKVSTPEKQRFGQMDRRALILSLHKENK